MGIATSSSDCQSIYVTVMLTGENFGFRRLCLVSAAMHWWRDTRYHNDSNIRFLNIRNVLCAA